MNVVGLILMKVDMNKIDVLRGDVMKFVVFNLKEPKVNNNYENVLNDLGQECEIKICEVGESMVFVTREHTITTSKVISVERVKDMLIVETKNSFYMFGEQE